VSTSVELSDTRERCECDDEGRYSSAPIGASAAGAEDVLGRPEWMAGSIPRSAKKVPSAPPVGSLRNARGLNSEGTRPRAEADELLDAFASPAVLLLVLFAPPVVLMLVR